MFLDNKDLTASVELCRCRQFAEDSEHQWSMRWHYRGYWTCYHHDVQQLVSK